MRAPNASLKLSYVMSKDFLCIVYLFWILGKVVVGGLLYVEYCLVVCCPPPLTFSGLLDLK